MTYLTDLNTYLHQSSLLIQAYPTSRITSKYSLPRKQDTSSKPQPQKAQPTDSQGQISSTQPKEKREPSATLTLKTYHPETGICLKYRTDKAQEVGRLIAGLGKLAKGEMIEMPTTSTAAPAGDKMDIDEPTSSAPAEKVDTPAPAQQQQTQTQPQGGKKKKKGKK